MRLSFFRKIYLIVGTRLCTVHFSKYHFQTVQSPVPRDFTKHEKKVT